MCECLFRRALFADHNLFWFRRWLRFIRGTANQKLFLCRRRSVFLIPTRAPFGLHFGVILEALGSFLASRSGIRKVLEGLGNEVRKRDVPGGPGGVPGAGAQGGGRSIMGGKSGHGEDNRRGRRPDHIPHAC